MSWLFNRHGAAATSSPISGGALHLAIWYTLAGGDAGVTQNIAPQNLSQAFYVSGWDGHGCQTNYNSMVSQADGYFADVAAAGARARASDSVLAATDHGRGNNINQDMIGIRSVPEGGTLETLLLALPALLLLKRRKPRAEVAR